MIETLQTRKEELEKRGKKGFTLMEMLIVIAIIAILIAIAIPIFTSQLEKAKESTDAANLRSAYATASAAILMEANDSVKGVSAGPVAMTQTGSWEHMGDAKVGNIAINGTNIPTDGTEWYVNVGKDGSVSITKTPATGYTKIDPVSGAKQSS